MNENTRWFQWLVGERRGQVLVFDCVEEDDGIIYIRFKDNSRINQELVGQLNQTDMTGKYMAEVDSPSNLWKFNEEVVGDVTGNRVEVDWESQTKYEIPSITEIMSDGQKLPEHRKKITLVPPRRTPPTHSVFGAIKRSTEAPPPPPPPPPRIIREGGPVEPNVSTTDTSDPVYILMNKSKKVDTEIQMNMTVALPVQAIYNMVKESFDEGDEKFVKYIIENITVDHIKNALKEAISSMYNKTEC